MELWRRNLLFVWLSHFVTSLGMMAFLPFLPFFLRELGVQDPGELRLWSGILVAGAPLSAAFLGPFWGALGDRYGRKVMMLRANAGIVVFVGLMSVVTGPFQLLALRVLQGVFSGFVAPGMTLVSVSTPETKQGRAVGFLHTALVAGGVIGPLLGGWIGDAAGYRWVFVACALFSAGALGITVLCVHEPEGTTQARAEERPSLRALGKSLLGDVQLLLRPGPLRSVLLAVFVLRFGVALIDPVLGLLVDEIAGHTERVATLTGIVFGATWTATLLMSPVLGRVGERTGHENLLLVCASAAAILYLVQSLAGTIPTLAWLRFASGACMAGVFPVSYAIAAKYSSRERRGSVYGMAFSSQGLANGTAPLLGGTLAATLGLRPLFRIAAVLMLLACARLLLERLQVLRASRARSGEECP